MVFPCHPRLIYPTGVFPIPVYKYGLSFEKVHLFAEIDGRKFVLDTGSPMSMPSWPVFRYELIQGD
jgi:hypothetical protein